MRFFEFIFRSVGDSNSKKCFTSCNVSCKIAHKAQHYAALFATNKSQPARTLCSAASLLTQTLVLRFVESLRLTHGSPLLFLLGLTAFSQHSSGKF
uniref:Secreted protein n=1 Tax=Ascaris lumbricoides TaxID=6252 RepID=A0A0M3IV72_ASCLU